MEGINYAAQKILDYQRKDDPPSHVNSGLMKLTLTRQSPNDIDDAALDGGEVTFQIPSEVKKDNLGAFDAVNTKVRFQTFKRSDIHPSTTVQVSFYQLLLSL